MGHVILKEFHLSGASDYFRDYVRRYTDMPMLVLLKERDGRHVPDHFLRASHLDGALGEQNNPDWKTLVYDEDSGDLVAPNGSIGFRWGEGAVNGGEKVGRWNLEARDGGSGRDITPRLSLIDQADAVVGVGFRTSAASTTSC